MNKLMLCTNATPVSELSVSITPSNISVSADNGKYKSPTFSASVFNGVGPFDYEWTATGVNFTPTVFNATLPESYFEVSGFNDIESVVMSCKVTDTSTMEEKTAIANAFIEFGERV